eukprot:362120-Chlamydomonas_euryale.AAC.6
MSLSQLYGERTHGGYACVERSKAEGIKQRGGCCHKGHAIAHGPEPCVDGSVVKQLLFAEGLVGLGGAIGRPRSTWCGRALAALHPVLTSHGVPHVEQPVSGVQSEGYACAYTGIPFMGPHR